MKVARVIFVRHGQSTWNTRHIWTGWENPPLSERGIQEARAAGEAVRAHGINFTLGFESDLLRAQQTRVHCLEEAGQPDIPTVVAPEIKERDYGQLTRMDKTRVAAEHPDQYAARRSFTAHPGPGWVAGVYYRGESLEQVVQRAWPYYLGRIQPAALEDGGRDVGVFGHGNSFRAIVMRLHGMSDSDVETLEIPWGRPIVYDLDSAGKVVESYLLTDEGAKLQVEGHWLGVPQAKQ